MDPSLHRAPAAPAASMVAPVRLLRYSGDEPWEPYEVQLGLATLHNRWHVKMEALHLGLELERRALQALLDIPPEDCLQPGRLQGALKQRFGEVQVESSARRLFFNRRQCGGEKLGALAADLSVLARWAYPSYPAPVQEDLALQGFLSVLLQERLHTTNLHTTM